MEVVHLQDCTVQSWLAHLTFYAGQEDAALAHLKEHLSGRVQRGRDTRAWCVWADAGQGHADAHVQRLPCSEVLQRRSPKDGFEKGRIGRESVDGGHKDICGVLRKWRDAVWRRTHALRSWWLWRFCSETMRDAPRTQRERQRQFSHNGGRMQRESDVCESVCEAGVLVHGGRRCRACHLCVCAH